MDGGATKTEPSRAEDERPRRLAEPAEPGTLAQPRARLDAKARMAELHEARWSFVKREIRSAWGFALAFVVAVVGYLLTSTGVLHAMFRIAVVSTLFGLPEVERALGARRPATRALFMIAHLALGAYWVSEGVPLAALPAAAGAAAVLSPLVPARASATAVLGISTTTSLLAAGTQPDHLPLWAWGTLIGLCWASLAWHARQRWGQRKHRAEAAAMNAVWDPASLEITSTDPKAQHTTARALRSDRHGEGVVIVSAAPLPRHALGSVRVYPVGCRSCPPPAPHLEKDLVVTPHGEFTLLAGEPKSLAHELRKGDLRSALDALVCLPHVRLLVSEDWVELVCRGAKPDPTQLITAHRATHAIREWVVDRASGMYR